MKLKDTTLEKIDGIGAFLSLACAIECTFFPVLIVTIPFLAADMGEHGALQKSLLAFSIVVSLFSCIRGIHKHKQRRLSVLVAGGIGLIAASFWESPQSDALAAGGALCLAVGHIVNRHFCRCCTGAK